MLDGSQVIEEIEMMNEWQRNVFANQNYLPTKYGILRTDPRQWDRYRVANQILVIICL